MFKKIFLLLVIVAAVLMVLVYSRGNYSITVNGEQIHGLREIIFAAGGLLVAGFAALGALLFVALVLAGTSMALLWIFAVLFLGLLFVFSPVLVPVAGVAIVIALIARMRRKGKSHQNGV